VASIPILKIRRPGRAPNMWRERGEIAETKESHNREGEGKCGEEIRCDRKAV